MSYPRRLETKDILLGTLGGLYPHPLDERSMDLYYSHLSTVEWEGEYTEFCSCHPRPAADLPAPKAGGGRFEQTIA